MPDWVLVSGGAGGIGSALCARLHGVSSIVGYRSDSAAAQEIAQRTNGAAMRLDLGDAGSIDQAIETIAERHQPLRGVVLAASPPPALRTLASGEDTDLQAQLAVNVTGPFRLLRGLIRRCFMRDKKGFVVAVLSSAMGHGTGAAAKGMSSYIAAKYALQGLVVAAKADYPWLAVHCEYPYYTETPMLRAFDERFLDGMRKSKAFEKPQDVAGRIAAWIEALP